MKSENLLTIANYAATTVNPRTGKPYTTQHVYRLLEAGTVKGKKIDGKQFIIIN